MFLTCSSFNLILLSLMSLSKSVTIYSRAMYIVLLTWNKSYKPTIFWCFNSYSNFISCKAVNGIPSLSYIKKYKYFSHFDKINSNDIYIKTIHFDFLYSNIDYIFTFFWFLFFSLIFRLVLTILKYFILVK